MCVCVCVCVTECICTLCLCCCTQCVTLSVLFRVWTSFNVLRIHVLRVVIWTSLKDVVRQRERKREAIPTASRNIPLKGKKRIKQELLAEARLLLLIPTCYFHRPFTYICIYSFLIYMYMYVYMYVYIYIIIIILDEGKGHEAAVLSAS